MDTFFFALAQRRTVDLRYALGVDKYPKHHWTVSKVLRKYPPALSTFRAHNLRCPGCGLNRHCTLADVANLHNIERAALLADVREKCLSNFLAKIDRPC
jgi:hypothetical protein